MYILLFIGESCSEVYEVHGSNKLGKGSYGSVYLATHRLTGDERAVKVMNVDRVTSYYLRKLHTEISILKCVDHPNIIKLQDVFFGKRSVYLVTDLCKGGELFELLNAGKNEGFVFREDRASQLMRDMLGAVHYLHSKVGTVIFLSYLLPYFTSHFILTHNCRFISAFFHFIQSSFI